MGSGERRTRFRTVCPSCGRVGTAVWMPEDFAVRCPGCGERYDYRRHTYRPVTGGMDEDGRRMHKSEVRRDYYRRNANREKARARERYAAWAKSATPEEREREAARVSAYRHASPERMQANRDRAAKWQREHREERREYERKWREAHREHIKVSAAKRRLAKRREKRDAS